MAKNLNFQIHSTNKKRARLDVTDFFIQKFFFNFSFQTIYRFEPFFIKLVINEATSFYDFVRMT